jgi:Tol biopolymer transport system component
VRGRGVWTVAVVAVLALASPGGGGSRSVAARTGLFEIGANGSGARALLQDPGLVLDLSPNRDQALLVRPNAGSFDLRTAELATGRERLLLRTSDWLLSGAWSPNGKLIAFDSSDSSACGASGCGQHQVWVVRPDGSGLRKVATRAEQPSWSPDSRWLLYVGRFDGATKRGVLTISTAAGHERRRLGRRGRIGSPRWSPDGRWIAYLGPPGEENGGAVSVIRADGRRLRKFGVGAQLAWSPGGRRLAFTRVGTPASLLTLERRNGRVRWLAASWDLAGPAWRPDGKALAYVRYTGAACGSETALDVVGLQGGSREVTPLPRCAQVPRVFWSRDGRELFYVSY